ncbi:MULTISPECIES: acyl-ACP desaturase [unclassified Streptomyces]|uniref:acyl-ACP desaturase n=1 Tax=unclassified Streptomyces TaxID=2593676 RepID=UPI003422D7E8
MQPPVGDPSQDDASMLRELEPTVAAHLDRHLSMAQEWFPHQYVPWSRGNDFDGPLQGQPWEPEQSHLPAHVRSALVLSLLTEDNLPSYHTELITELGRDGAWGAWAHRWTAEEDRHSTVLRDYLHVTRAVDPVALERHRMQHMSNGYTREYAGSVIHGIAYVMVQEQATRVAHRNTGRISGDPVCERLLSRIAADENLHMVFYRDLLAEAFDRYPDRTMRALSDVVCAFRMPGYGAPNLQSAARSIAVSGILDRQVLLVEILQPLLRSLRVFERTGLTGPGEDSRERLGKHLDRQRIMVDRLAQRLAEHGAQPVLAAQGQDQGPQPALRTDR